MWSLCTHSGPMWVRYWAWPSAPQGSSASVVAWTPPYGAGTSPTPTLIPTILSVSCIVCHPLTAGGKARVLLILNSFVTWGGGCDGVFGIGHSVSYKMCMLLVVNPLMVVVVVLYWPPCLLKKVCKLLWTLWWWWGAGRDFWCMFVVVDDCSRCPRMKVVHWFKL